MANVPIPKSYDKILGEMLRSYIAKIGVNDLNTGSAILSFFEAIAQSIYRASGDVFSILRDFSVDRATGEALQRLAIEENLNIIPAKVSTGEVTISDSSFEKISTKVYAGSNPPNVGAVMIKVADAGEFPATGSIYIGRGTPNIEEYYEGLHIVSNTVDKCFRMKCSQCGTQGKGFTEEESARAIIKAVEFWNTRWIPKEE